MNDYSLIGVLVALVGVLKGKDVWDYLKAKNESKNKAKSDIIILYESQLKECKERNEELEDKNEALSDRLQKHLLKSKGKKNGPIKD